MGWNKLTFPCFVQSPQRRIVTRRAIEWRVAEMGLLLPAHEQEIYQAILTAPLSAAVPQIETVFQAFEIPFPTLGQLSRFIK